MATSLPSEVPGLTPLDDCAPGQPLITTPAQIDPANIPTPQPEIQAPNSNPIPNPTPTNSQTRKPEVLYKLDPDSNRNFIFFVEDLQPSNTPTPNLQSGQVFTPEGQSIFTGQVQFLSKSPPLLNLINGTFRTFWFSSKTLKFQISLKNQIPKPPIRYYTPTGKLFFAGTPKITPTPHTPTNLSNFNSIEIDVTKFGTTFYPNGSLNAYLSPNHKLQFSYKGFP